MTGFLQYFLWKLYLVILEYPNIVLGVIQILRDQRQGRGVKQMYHIILHRHGYILHTYYTGKWVQKYHIVFFRGGGTEKASNNI